MMDKNKIIQGIIKILSEELDVLSRSAKDAHTSATHEETAAKSKYDTQAIEASYLAQGQAKRVSELERGVASFKKIASQNLSNTDTILVGSLAQLSKKNQPSFWIFYGPDGGGIKVTEADTTITVITKHSPLGAALLTAKAGDVIEVEQGNAIMEYKVLTVQ